MPAALTAQQEVVAAIQVHGNTLTSSDDIIRASGIGVGDSVSDALLSEAEARLRAAMKLDSVDVLKRFASISDPTQVLILIQVDEGPVRIDIPDVDGPRPRRARSAGWARSRAVRRSRFSVMFLPILGAEDGYGFTYGAQFAFAGHRNMSAAWSCRRAGAETSASPSSISRSFRGVSRRGCGRARFLQRRTHPFFDEHARPDARVGKDRVADSPRAFMPAPRSRGNHPRSPAKKSRRDR